MLTTATVTDLDEFARYLGDENYTLEAIVDRLSKPFSPTPEMIAGTALHEWLEVAHVGEVEEIVSNGHRFRVECDIELPLSPIRELRITERLGPVFVRGRIDELEGKAVKDHKTTRSMSSEKYLDGWQWRLYLTMLHANRFRWNIFVLGDTKEEVENKDYRIREFHKLEALSYPDMRRDCIELAQQFHNFAIKHLPSRILK